MGEGQVRLENQVRRISHGPLDGSVIGVSAFREEQFKANTSNLEILIGLHILGKQVVRVTGSEGDSLGESSSTSGTSVLTSYVADSEITLIITSGNLDRGDEGILLFDVGQRFVLHLSGNLSSSSALLFISASTGDAFASIRTIFFHFLNYNRT